MATGCDQRSLDSFGVPLGVRMINGSCAIPVVTEGHVTPLRKCLWGVLYDVRVLYLAWLTELATRVLYLAWLLELALVICPFYFHIMHHYTS
jgi:hypothetical protein